MKINQKSRSTTNDLMQNGLTALCSVGTILLIWWLLKYSAYGIDFTDESFYLVWMANPFIYNGSITQFGFVYHPLYRLLNGDIAALRQANILITFALAWGLTYSVFISLAVGLKENRITQLVVSAACATSSLILFDYWLPTPGYNSLNLQALLITATGLVLAEKTAHRTSILGWLLMGTGGWLVFMAKPSTALALAVGAFIFLLLARKLSIRMLLLAAACALALLLISALIIDGSIANFVKRHQLGIDLASTLGGGHTLGKILRIDIFYINRELALSIFLLTSAVFIALWSMYAENKKWGLIGPLVSITFFALTTLITLDKAPLILRSGQFQGLLIFGLICALAIATLALGRPTALASISMQQWAIAALFLVMPHIYAFGTSGNYWQAGSSAAFFWLLAGLPLLAPMIREHASWLHGLQVAFAVQAVTATLLQTGLEQPYRQTQSLRLNASTLEIGPQKASLVLSKDYAEYFATAMSAAEKAGFLKNTSMIDLTGQSPGILYALGARSIGQAWMIGGLPGSLKLAEAVLARTSCEEISAAWILFENDGPRSIPMELMPSLGANFPNDYKLVATWRTAGGAGGYKAPRTQELYEPLEQNKTLMTCLKLRKEIAQ